VMGFEPSLIGCYIWDQNHSFEMIRKNRECVINIPTYDLAAKVVGIGNSSGRDVGKFAVTARAEGRRSAPSRSAIGSAATPTVVSAIAIIAEAVPGIVRAGCCSGRGGDAIRDGSISPSYVPPGEAGVIVEVRTTTPTAIKVVNNLDLVIRASCDATRA
jgi:hypothetical protein